MALVPPSGARTLAGAERQANDELTDSETELNRLDIAQVNLII